MKTRRYSEAQVLRILKEVESGMPVVNAAREHGVSPATIHRWKGKCGGMTLSVSGNRRDWELSQRRPRRHRMGPVGKIINKAEYPNHIWSYDFVGDRTERVGN